MVQRLKAQGLKMASINTNGMGDMGNQYEDPDFVQYRQQQQAQQQEGDEIAAAVDREHYQGSGGQGRGRGSLAEVSSAYGRSMQGTPNVRPAPRAAPAPASSMSPTQRLGDLLDSGNIYSRGVAPGSAYNRPSPRPGTSGGGAAVKPVSLANFVNNSNNGGVGGRR